MSQQKHPYQSTTVPVSRSQEAIRKILYAHGAIATQFTDYPMEGIIELKWARQMMVDGANVQQPARYRISTEGKKEASVYRALFWHLKTKFEIVDFGIVTYEEEFLPYFVTYLPNGQETTVAEQAMPWIRKGLPPHLQPLAPALPPSSEPEIVEPEVD